MITRLIFLLVLFFSITGLAQVKQEYLYNTSMPYGVLDIRTQISSSNYYYLQEGITFSFRESSPGVKTNTYLDMTPWDSSPYGEGNLRKKDGSKDEFIMNYRILQPLNYSSNYTQGYPMIVIFHGAIERANCYYGNCYHSNPKYNPNINNPPAPTTVDHKLLNNDNHLTIGAPEHLKARDAAGGKLPNDVTLPPSAFPGFVLMPQMMNVWDSLNVQDVIRLVQLHCKKYNIDENRIYIEGLSIGGYGVYEALKRASWLFAAAVPMSSVSEAANIFKHNQQKKVAHVPLWVFQGGYDTNPSPSFTEAILNKFRNAGALPKYTLYSSSAHRVWERAYAEPNFFQWLLSKSKKNIHVAFGTTQIDKNKNSFPTLILAEGFLAYQWEKDGVIISSAKTNQYSATQPGVYRARFSRQSTNPKENEWNYWSEAVTITGEGKDEDPDEDEDDNSGDDENNEDNTDEDGDGGSNGNNSGNDNGNGGDIPKDSTEVITGIPDIEAFDVQLYPNPVSGNDVFIDLNQTLTGPATIYIYDAIAKPVYIITTDAIPINQLALHPNLQAGIYLIIIKTEKVIYQKRLVVK